MMLPEMGGEEVFRAIRRRRSAAKVLICSGYSLEGKAAQVLSEGANAFLQKPFGSEELLRAIGELLR